MTDSPTTPLIFSPLSGSTAPFQALIEYSADLITLFDRDGRILYQSPSVQRHLGCERNPTAEGHHVDFTALHLEDRERISQQLMRLLPGVTVSLSPYRLQHANGSWCWLEGTAINLLHDPSMGAILVQARDATLRVHADRRARALEGLSTVLASTNTTSEVVQVILLQGLESMGASAGSVMLVNPDRQHVDVLGSAGYPARDERPWRRFPLESPVPAADAIREGRDLFLTREDWLSLYPQWQHLLTPTSGSHAVLTLRMNGHVMGAITLSFAENAALSETQRRYLRTIAAQCALALERSELNARLQQQERFYRKITEYSHDLVSIIGLDGVTQYISPAMMPMLGYTPEERVGGNAFDGIHPEDLGRVMQVFQEAVISQVPVLATYRFQHKAGHWVWLESTGVNSTDDPDIGGVMINTRDVTVRIEAEKTLHLQLRRFQHLVHLTADFAAQDSLEQLIQAALEHCLDLTAYDYGFFFPIDGNSPTKPLRAGQVADELFAWTTPWARAHRTGAVGQALRRQVAFFAGPAEPVFNPPEALPRRIWTSLAVLPIVTREVLRGFLAFGTNDAVDVDEDSRRLLLGVGEQTSRVVERSVHLNELQQSREETLRAMGLALEYRDYETKGHTDRVVAFTEQLGRVLGFSGADLDALRWGAFLHDTGKVAIPDAILLKPGKLTPEEWDVIKRHPGIGYEMLEHIPSLPPTTLDVVLYHQERWNGSGYPKGLAGTDIPLAARVFAVIDVYDALTSERPYKKAWTHQEAAEQLRQEAGVLLDERVVQAFLHIVDPEGEPFTQTTEVSP
ncbi:HD domain-containing phosphohydrolase [Deinococcus sp. QL22]|uniref:HD domain-containing phosphohydrolase n=1 Tax=Deinococcus sp. QL22 TaxID=2939437 RepID=UPI0020171D61|nr:HD domain-containing phosphohydrolase [Deinococcus sp. QL22]UQN10755.1 PAS domain S-box protein [Deinococcus sp. QL22]UQN10801.1 PAS domain S-box protein [Deinococcus sp. QL22]